MLSAALLVSCKKSGPSDNGDNNNNSGNGGDNNGPKSTPDAAMSVTPSALNVYLPSKCVQVIYIKNTGATGSILRYKLALDGEAGDYLALSNTEGTVNGGLNGNFFVWIKTGLPNDGANLVGTKFELDISTTIGSNKLKVAIPLSIKSNRAEEAELAGAWSGTWNGTDMANHSPGHPETFGAVSGTWALTINSVDTVSQTFKGNLVWKGTDVYWTYTYATNGDILTATSYPFIPDRTVKLDATNTSIVYDGNCTNFNVVINITGPDPSDAFYGPWFSADFNLMTGDVVTYLTENRGFITHPYNKSISDTTISTGVVTGKKQ